MFGALSILNSSYIMRYDTVQLTPSTPVQSMIHNHSTLLLLLLTTSETVGLRSNKASNLYCTGYDIYPCLSITFSTFFSKFFL
jgi:hypothetical protein